MLLGVWVAVWFRFGCVCVGVGLVVGEHDIFGVHMCAPIFKILVTVMLM